MKRLVLLACAAVVALGPVASRADDPITGHVQIGHPITSIGAGVSELAAACAPGDDLDGIDGKWILLPEDAAGKTLTIRPTGSNVDLQDFDGFFYGAGCAYMDAPTLDAKGAGEAEEGVVPDGAVYVIADLFTGADATFEITLV